MFNLGVPAQSQQGLNQIILGAVVLYALSFLFFCHPKQSLSVFALITKKDAAAITHATYNLQLTTRNLQPN
jgi:hypothetical protein